MRFIIILLCFVVPPFEEIDQFISASLSSTPLFPEWFTWVDNCCRGLLILKMSYDMVHFNKYWKDLMETMRLAQQFEEMKRKAMAMDMKPSTVPAKFSPNKEHDVDFLWD